MGNLRTKFSVITVLILVLTMGVSSYFFISRTVGEISQNLLFNALNFAELATPGIADAFGKQPDQSSYPSFLHVLQGVLPRNTDIAQMRIIDKEGRILFDSIVEQQQRYEGPARMISDADMIERLREVRPSIRFRDGTVTYIESRDKLQNLNPFLRGVNVVFPLPDRTYGMEYVLSYQNLDRYIISTVSWMGLIALGLLAFGIAVALMFVKHILRPVERLKEGALEIGKGNLDTHIDVTSRDELGLLTGTFNSMVENLKKNTKALVEKERLDNEIRLAAEIQSDFIPKNIPKIEGLDIAASVVPATEIGGDCYDFIRKGDDLMIFMADVSGHGVSAGLVEAITSSLVFTLSRHSSSTVDIMSGMNIVIHEKTRPNVFVTSIMGVWESHNNCFKYSVAGHDPIIYYNAEIRKCTLLSKGGMALGMLPDIQKLLTEEEMCLKKNDMLILYTDGIPEAWNAHQKQLGMKRFMEIIERHAELPAAQQVHDGIVGDVQKFIDGAKQADDITLMVLKKL